MFPTRNGVGVLSDADNKPKRAAILEKYAEEIEQLYAE